MKTCIILNGELSISENIRQQIKTFDKIIAADGGANKCYELDIVPDYIIGDFDSVRAEVIQYFTPKKTQIVAAPSQNTVDFQEAIWLAEAICSDEEILLGLEARRKLFQDSLETHNPALLIDPTNPFQITVFGGLSDSEIDHTIGNLLLGVSLPVYLTLKFYNPNSDIYITKKSLTLEGHKNDIVSVIPLQKTTGLSYSHLLYCVDNLTVNVGWLGSRNRMTGQQASISFTSGTLLIVRHKSNIL